MRHVFLCMAFVGLLCAMIAVGCARFEPILISEEGGAYRFNLEKRDELIKIEDGATGKIATDSNVAISYNIKKYADVFIIKGLAEIPEVPARATLQISFYAVIGDESTARIEKILEQIYFQTQKKPTEFKFEVRAADQDVYFYTLFRGYASWEAYQRVRAPSIYQGRSTPYGGAGSQGQDRT